MCESDTAPARARPGNEPSNWLAMAPPGTDLLGLALTQFCPRPDRAFLYSSLAAQAK
jgi:hypothetical protein